MNHRVPGDSIELGSSLASSLCRKAPRGSRSTQSPKPATARSKTAFLTRAEIVRLFWRPEQRSAAQRPKGYQHGERKNTGQSMVAQRVGIEPAAFARIVADINPLPTTGKTAIPITRKMRRPARNACSEERINPAKKHQTKHQPNEWNVIEEPGALQPGSWAESPTPSGELGTYQKHLCDAGRDAYRHGPAMHEQRGDRDDDVEREAISDRNRSA